MPERVIPDEHIEALALAIAAIAGSDENHTAWALAEARELVDSAAFARMLDYVRAEALRDRARVMPEHDFMRWPGIVIVRRQEKRDG